MLFEFGYVSLRWIWVALTVIFAIIEVFTLGLTTVWFALAALVLVFLFFLPIPFIAQIIIFLAISAGLLFFTRPIAIKKFKTGRVKTNVDSLIGKHALVTKQIGEFDTGEIKLNGQIWSAKLLPETEYDSNNTVPAYPVLEGTKCEVVRIEGVMAIVRVLIPDNS
jgi:membrane protein implicated in regulation of membrane protease activity